MPYPSKETTRRLATLTGLSAQQVRHIARSARSGRCARPWHGEAPAQKRRETFARRRHFYFAVHKFALQRLLDGVKGTSATTQARRLRDAARRDGLDGLRRPAAGVSAARARVKSAFVRGSRRQRKARWHKSPSPRRTWKIASSPYTRRLDARRVDIGEKRDYAKFEERWALHRLGPVGRLDKATTGLLLFTDDGGLAKRLVAAGTCRKTYVLDVAGDVTDAALASLARPLDDVTLHTREAVRTAPADVAVLRRDATAVFEAASVLSFNRPRVDGVALGPRRVDGVRGAAPVQRRRRRRRSRSPSPRAATARSAGSRRAPIYK